MPFVFLIFTTEVTEVTEGGGKFFQPWIVLMDNQPARFSPPGFLSNNKASEKHQCFSEALLLLRTKAEKDSLCNSVARWLKLFY
jgi:hypothetical protein